MNVISYLMMQAERRLVQTATQVQRARSLPEVVRHMNPPLPPQVRPLVRSSAGYRHFQRTLEQTAETIVNAQLDALQGSCEPERSLLLQRYQRQEWVCLRGNFPRLASYVNRQLQQMKIDAQRSAPKERLARPLQPHRP